MGLPLLEASQDGPAEHSPACFVLGLASVCTYSHHRCVVIFASSRLTFWGLHFVADTVLSTLGGFSSNPQNSPERKIWLLPLYERGHWAQWSRSLSRTHPAAAAAAPTITTTW